MPEWCNCKGFGYIILRGHNKVPIKKVCPDCSGVQNSMIRNIAIIDLHNSGMSHAEIADIYGMCKESIDAITRKRKET